MDQPHHTSETKSEVAHQKPRDADGQFIHSSSPSDPPHPPLGSLLSSSPLEQHIHYDNNQDDLLNVHVGNPLRRITVLLEEIKHQKAFNFTLKGSLGVMGVVLVLSTFGIFGGTRILCDKGRQTHIGVVKNLIAPDDPDSTIPLIGPVIDYYSNFINPARVMNPKNRTILITTDHNTIYLHQKRDVDYASFLNQTVFITGNYDACARILTPQTMNDIETTL